MNKIELNLVFNLIVIFALRMLGIFMALPILPIYAISLHGSYEHLVGISIGIYGIMQIIFQLPFGFISDKIGRKPVIIIGLILSAAGNEIASITNEIWGLIFSRALQGSSAIGSVLITLLLESVREQFRAQIMAIIGITFGLTFIISMVLGPFLANIFGLQGFFQIITIITILTILLAFYKIPTITLKSTDFHKNINYSNIFNDIKSIIIHKKLLKLNFNIFCLHTILILNLISWPKIITNLGYMHDLHYKIYASVISISILITFPIILFLNTKKYKKKILTIAIYILFLSELIMYLTIKNIWMFLLGIQLFFIAFNLMESILPFIISKNSPQQYKGTAISIYSIGQFLGVSLGSISGGWLLEYQEIQLLFLYSLTLTVINIILINTLHKLY